MSLLLDELRDDITGLQTLKDWIGDGGVPVPSDQSSSRAMACLSGNEGKPCPHNREIKWWETAKGAIADAIHQQLEVKNRLKISTPFDSQLHVCDVCRCKLDLKVHTPIKHIAEHTAPEKIGEYPPYCWQLKEIQ